MRQRHQTACESAARASRTFVSLSRSSRVDQRELKPSFDDSSHDVTFAFIRTPVLGLRLAHSLELSSRAGWVPSRPESRWESQMEARARRRYELALAALCLKG